MRSRRCWKVSSEWGRGRPSGIRDELPSSWFRVPPRADTKVLRFPQVIDTNGKVSSYLNLSQGKWLGRCRSVKSRDNYLMVRIAGVRQLRMRRGSFLVGLRNEFLMEC